MANGGPPDCKSGLLRDIGGFDPHLAQRELSDGNLREFIEIRIVVALSSGLVQSSPVWKTFASIAQQVEQAPLKREVVGSIPSGRT